LKRQAVNREARLDNHYEVTIITVRPGTPPKALQLLKKRVETDSTILACWNCEIGALNQIMLIRHTPDVAAAINARMKILTSGNPFGVGELITHIAIDTYAAFDFLPPIKPGELGPCYEVRTYTLKPDGLAPTIEIWRKAAAARHAISPILTAMSSVTGEVVRFMHIWPYKSLDERARLRAKAITDGVWPPPGGPDQIATQLTDIYLPAPFSPLR
jgi:NIPSNAP